MNFLKSNVLFLFLLFVSASCNKNKQVNWVLKWEDDFNRDDIFSTGDWRKIKRQYPTPVWMSHISDYEGCYDIVDGQLILRGLINTCLPDDTARFLTGGITTKGLKSFHRGRIDVKAKLQAAKGAWPAIWLLPDNGSWPEGGEIDIMERLHYDNYIHQTIHSSYTVNFKKTENPPHHQTVPFDSAQYNVFSVVIDKDSISWYVNDIHTFTYPRLTDEFSTQNEQYPYDRPYYLIIDMQLGATWMPPVEKKNLPVEMLVDWVRYYQRKEN